MRRCPSVLLLAAVLPRLVLGLQMPTAATGPLQGKLPPSFSLPNGKSVILFDGVCNFCNAWVNFVLGAAPHRT